MTSRSECHDCGSRPHETRFPPGRKRPGKPLRCCDCRDEAAAVARRTRPLAPSMTRRQRRRLRSVIAGEQLARDWSPQLDLFDRTSREPPP